MSLYKNYFIFLKKKMEKIYNNFFPELIFNLNDKTIFY